MCAVELKKGKREYQNGEGFRIYKHAAHNRMYYIELEDDVVNQFLEDLRDVSDEQLEYIPYMRLVVADKLLQLTSEDFGRMVRDILHDRETGGFTIGLQNQTTDPQDFVKFSTALSHLAGLPNFDAMSGKYYARFAVKHTDSSDSYLRQAYRLFTLHTDGTYVDEPTDWLLMMKMDEQNAMGGRSRLLHLDDWEDLDHFYHHPLAAYPFKYKAPASKNVEEDVYRQTFYEQNNKPCICFIDQFAYPETIDHANYLKDLSSSMENSEATIGLDLPVGDLIMLNNRFWLHGREPFEENTQLHRELLRQRGRFAK
ncbi:glutarate dioxygenase GlaH [Thalassobacillus pellis]|uniref:glutarate dioxygenase GlaH n=1 Tax=Thalassobacillus pellis TaxID=748008 RepID=UPI001961567D|nr:glutarate dioxygenase GlaH [Thalassobacillus pellis]MBM7553345.1 protein CsiD [Thalassobacillus pellis]